MLQCFGIFRKKKSTKPSKSDLPAAVEPKPDLAVEAPNLAVATFQNETPLPELSSLDSFDATLDLAITACNTIKEIGDVIPEPAATPIKATFGIFIFVLETVKRCKENREGWKSLAEVVVEKNKRVEALLRLYIKAPEEYPNALEQSINYRRVLNMIIVDIKRETETPEETTKGLESYWSRMKARGREAALSNINAGRITSYQDQLRTITLDTIEEIVIRGASVAIDTHRLVQMLAQQSNPAAPMILPKPRPRVVGDFIGREYVLSAMRHTHFEDKSDRHEGPIITVLIGMGGSGKTQIAVKFASQFEERFPDAPVYFLNASSSTSLEGDLKSLLKSQAASYDDALAWLATGVPNWLLIMDNADDPSLDLSRYLPQSSHGHIVITTRNETYRAFSPRSTHVVDALPLEESITLLLRSSGSEENDANRLFAKDIVEEVGCLPLAISHAAAYISVHGRLGAYLQTYRKSQLRFLNRRPTQANSYPHSVASTIQLSYDCLSLEAQQLLQLFSYFDIRSIPRSIIEGAAERGFEHVAWKTKLPLNDTTIEYANVLRGIFCPEGEWDDSRFDDMTEECLKYSLIQSTVVGESYSMHSLVQAYLHSTSPLVQNHPPQRLITRLLASSITIDPSGNPIMFNQLLLPHIRLVAVADVTEAGDHYSFGYVLMDFGDGLAVIHLQQCLGIWRRLLGDDNADTLAAMNMLAAAYWSLGRIYDALPLQEEVLEKYKKLFGPDDHNTLIATDNLAATYTSLGKAKDVLTLQEDVLEKYRKMHGPDHVNTLMAMGNLASTYESLGRPEDALPLQEEALKKWKKLLGPDNLNTLKAMSNLANTYAALGRATDALPLREEVVEKWKKTLGPDHFNTLTATHNLASTYSSLGRFKDALPLQEELLEQWRKMLGPDHFNTLAAMNNLAETYQSVGRANDALPLQEEVLKKWKKLLGPDHRDTLQAVYNLLSTYNDLKMDTKLEELGRTELPVLERVYGEDHKYTVWVKEKMEALHGRG